MMSCMWLLHVLLAKHLKQGKNRQKQKNHHEIHHGQREATSATRSPVWLLWKGRRGHQISKETTWLQPKAFGVFWQKRKSLKKVKV